jgi:hypothetical protein
MPFDSSHLMSTVSLVGSVATAAATAYFWAVRVRREQPNLKIYACERATEVNLGVYRGETRGLQFRAGVIVANYSSMPNAAIAVEVALKRRDGSWEEVPAPRATGLPFNIPPMTTAKLELEWSVTLPALAAAETLRPVEIGRAYLDHYYADALKSGVSIWALGEREFRAVLPLLPERTAAAPLAEAA